MQEPYENDQFNSSNTSSNQDSRSITNTQPSFNSEPKNTSKKNLFSRTKFYLFEYISLQIANLWLGIGFSIAIFSLFSVVGGSSISTSIVESLAWVFGLVLVLSPATAILYARTSGEETVNPARLHQTLRKTVFYGMLTIVTISAAGFLVAAVYTASRVLFGIGDAKSLVSVSVPSLIVLLLHVYYVGFVIKGVSISPKLRRLNIVGISALGTLLLVVIAGTAIISGKGVSDDKNTVKELEITSAAINKEYKNTGELPGDIENLATLSNKDIKDKFRSGEYTYEKIEDRYYYDTPVDSQTDSTQDSSSTTSSDIVDPGTGGYGNGSSYKICASFKTSTSSYDIYTAEYSYDTQSNFSMHSKGKDCFNLNTYDNYPTNSVY